MVVPRPIWDAPEAVFMLSGGMSCELASLVLNPGVCALDTLLAETPSFLWYAFKADIAEYTPFSITVLPNKKPTLPDERMGFSLQFFAG